MGMLTPHKGRVSVFGLSPTEHPIEVKKRIGYVAEDQVLPPMSSIADLIAFHEYLFPKWDRRPGARSSRPLRPGEKQAHP